ncbi:hypothetical protein [Flavobacterium anhuiense]|uniref:hypothetical protein n=1 Tax=Flavobacterium anhuiense TaxID=459526 RepID=UPI003D97B019
MKKILLHPIVILIAGFVLNGIAWSVNIGHPFNTICLVFGLGLFFLGIILSIIKIRG